MKRLFCLLLLLALLLSACGGEETSAQTDRPTEGVGVVTLSAVGDIYLTDDMLADARKPDGSYDFLPQLSGVFSILNSADLAVGNFEGTFSGAPYGPSSGSYPDELADTLSAAGFDLLQTANSFSIFNGLLGLQRTRAVIAENGMTPVGTYDNAAQRRESSVVLREVNGVRIAFFALTKGLGGMSLPEGAEDCVDLIYTDYATDYSEMDTASILAQIDEAKALDADFIVALVHWGSEGVRQVDEKQEELANYLFFNGVDIILGAHSHLPARVEQRTFVREDGSERTVVVAYSLGDFCAAEAGKCNASPILTLTLSRDHATGQTDIGEVHYSPIAALDRGGTFADRYAVLDIDNTVALYENHYYKRVSQELYETLLQKRDALAGYLFPED